MSFQVFRELTIEDIQRICEKSSSELTYDDMENIDSYFPVYTNFDRYKEILATGVKFSFHVNYYQDPTTLMDFCIQVIGLSYLPFPSLSITNNDLFTQHRQMNLKHVKEIASDFIQERVWPALVLVRDTPGRDERKWIEELYATLPDADVTLPYLQKLNAPGMKAKIAAAFSSFTSIPSQYKITLPLFGGNHTTMAQQQRLAKLVQDGKAVTDRDMLRLVV